MLDFNLRDEKSTFKHQMDKLPDAYQENYKEHYHTSYELFLFIQGDADFIVQQGRYKLKPYDLVMVKPGEHHNIIINSEAAYERVVIRFDDSDLPPSLSKEMQKLGTRFNLKESKLAEEFQRMGYYTDVIPNELLLDALRSQLVIILSCLCSSINLQKKADSTNKELEHILEYIDENASKIMSVQDICVKVNKSQSSIQKLFYNQFRTSVMAYVRTKKCMNAYRLLSNGIPAKDVYERCGFETYSTFYRSYMKTYGLSPSSAQKKETATLD